MRSARVLVPWIFIKTSPLPRARRRLETEFQWCRDNIRYRWYPYIATEKAALKIVAGLTVCFRRRVCFWDERRVAGMTCLGRRQPPEIARQSVRLSAVREVAKARHCTWFATFTLSVRNPSS